MKFTCLLVVAVMLFVVGACAHAPQEEAAPRALVIDVRTDQEWRGGHLDGAILIPHERTAREIASVAPDRKARIYLYCRTGRRSGLVFDELKKAGYEDLVNLETLERASRELNLPIVK